MASESWEKIKNRLSSPTVQDLYEHTEEIDRRMEMALVGLFNAMVDHRAKVEEVSSQLALATDLAQSHQKMQESVRKAYLFAVVNIGIALFALTIAFVK